MGIKCAFTTSLLCLFGISDLYADFQVHEVAEGIYVHYGLQEQINAANKGDIANIGFIVGAESVAVIDTGGSRGVGQALMAQIAQVTDLPVRYVIITHAHPDHMFGASAFDFVDRPVDIAGHKNLANTMIQRGEYYTQRFQNEFGFGPEELELLPQTLFVDSEMELDLGARKLRLVAMDTAHTNNDLVVIDERTRTVWTGDLVFREHVPVIDGSIRGWERVMVNLQNLDVTSIIPGHGPVAKKWEEALSDQQEYFDALTTGVQDSINNGQTIQQAVATVAQDESGNWLLFGDYHPQNISRVFAELEWE